MKPIMRETFGRMVDAIVDSSGLAKIDQSLEAGWMPRGYRVSLKGAHRLFSLA
jgi:hypothetical protein